MFELIAFLVFLGAFTSATMMFKDRSQTHFLEALFRERVVPETQIKTPEDFWNFVETRVAPVLRGDNLTGMLSYRPAAGSSQCRWGCSCL
jgi:hypothetical protein